jgi:leucine dehydrogenase
MAEETGCIATGDLAPACGLGIMYAIRGACDVVFGSPDLSGRSIAVQGLGDIGWNLCRALVGSGAEISVADLDAELAARAAGEFGATKVSPEDILGMPVDVLAPCAVGGIVTTSNIESFRCRIVCGGANNILSDDAAAELLQQAGIVFVPDVLSNSGATVQGVLRRVRGAGDYLEEVAAIEDRTRSLLAVATEAGCTPLAAAMQRIRS